MSSYTCRFEQYVAAANGTDPGLELPEKHQNSKSMPLFKQLLEAHREHNPHVLQATVVDSRVVIDGCSKVINNLEEARPKMNVGRRKVVNGEKVDKTPAFFLNQGMCHYMRKYLLGELSKEFVETLPEGEDPKAKSPKRASPPQEMSPFQEVNPSQELSPLETLERLWDDFVESIAPEQAFPTESMFPLPPFRRFALKLGSPAATPLEQRYVDALADAASNNEGLCPTGTPIAAPGPLDAASNNGGFTPVAASVWAPGPLGAVRNNGGFTPVAAPIWAPGPVDAAISNEEWASGPLDDFTWTEPSWTSFLI